jgi:hypothetical protein
VEKKMVVRLLKMLHNYLQRETEVGIDNEVKGNDVYTDNG